MAPPYGQGTRNRWFRPARSNPQNSNVARMIGARMTPGHDQRVAACKELLTITASLINIVLVRDELHTYSILGYVLCTMYLSVDQDMACIVKMTEDALDMGADPNLLTYMDNDTSTPFYSCYELALFLSYKLYSGYQMNALLDRLKACGGVVQRSTFERWDQDIQHHVMSKSVAIKDITAALPTLSPPQTWGCRLQPLAGHCGPTLHAP